MKVMGLVATATLVVMAGFGAILFILGSIGRPVGGRRHYW